MSFQDVAKRSRISRRSSESRQKENLPLKMNSPPRRKSKKLNIVTAAPPELSPDSSKSSTRNSPTSTGSRFSALNNEIVQFQGMVRKLESLVKRSGDTPEDQWRSRILIRSAKEADSDIASKIQSLEHSPRMVFDPSVRASYQKLIRDYKRIHDSFATLMFQYTKIQHETIAQFGGEQGWMSPEEVQKQKATKHEEDFFDRAMREREAEILAMNQSMHKVNNIYEELGRIVQSQQEHINTVEDHVKDSKVYAEAGLEQLRFPYCGQMQSDQPRDPPPRLRSNENFRWTMPFETIGEDMKEVVQKDILGLGSDIISMTNPRKMFQCAKVEDVSEKAVY